MSFIAGIISFDQLLEERDKRRFLDAFGAMREALSWPVGKVEGRKSVLVQASFPHMWQGPKILSQPEIDAAAIGVQWTEIPHRETALDYLINALSANPSEIDNYFDTFSCAIVDKSKDWATVATDSVGMSPLLYKGDKRVLVFSSHQLFMRRFLGPEFDIDWDAVFEYLLIGHCIGDKTLLKDVKVLPPGCKLILGSHGLTLIQYARWDDHHKRKIDLRDASDLLFERLQHKCRSYSSLANKPVAGFLSGGWDSRLLVSMFSRIQNMATTFTSQQKVRFQNHLISEKKIAREVAQHIGVNNRFVPPYYRNTENRDRRARMLDYTTWFHDWAFGLAQRLPYDKFIFCDGLIGDILLRGLYVPSALRRAMELKDRDGAITFLHSQYVNGFNPYTRGIEKWKSVIQPRVLDDFSDRLRQAISREIRDIEHEDFITIFHLRNRSRRGISPLPRFIFGQKGAIVFPFCDSGFVRESLSLPMKFKLDHALFRALLERSKPGLSKIVSTNTKDPQQLVPYMTDVVPGQSSWDQVLGILRESGADLCQVVRGVKHRMVGKTFDFWAKDIIENPPVLLMDPLVPDLKNAVKDGNMAYLKPHRFYLDRIKMLDHLFS